MWKYVFAWIPMVLIAIANGALREGSYGKYVGELMAHQISTLSAVLLLGIYLWLVVRRWPPERPGQAVAIGLIWLGLTVVFEFVFGRYVAGLSWTKLLSDYNIFAGRAWVAVLVWITIAPYVFYRFNEARKN